MSRAIQHGSTDQGVILQICNTDGTPKEDVVYNTASLALWYRRAGGAKVAITTASLSALTDAHSDGGFLHIDDGAYRLDSPDAACAGGAAEVVFGGSVPDGVIIPVRVPLVAYDPQSVRVGAAAAGAQMDLVDAPNATARLAFSVTAVTADTGETAAAAGSQAKLSQGSGGGGSTPISPIQSTLKNGVLVKSGPIDLLYKEGRTVKIACVDTTNTPIDLTGISVEFVAETRDRAQLFLIETADITLENGEEDVLNTVVIDFTATHASHRGLDHKYAVRRVGDPNTVYATEKLRVEHVPINGG